MTIPQAQLIGGTFTDPSAPHVRECPFGGLIIISGDPVVGHSYRLMARPYPPPTPNYPGAQVANRITVFDATDFLNPIKNIDPQIDGWFDYLPFLQNWGAILSYWYPPDGDWQIRIEMGTQSIPHIHETYTDWYRVKVNNIGPTADTVHIALDVTGRCGEFAPGDQVKGTFDANSPYFGYYHFSVAPIGLIGHDVVPGGYPSTPALPGSVWTLETGGAKPCGYVVTLSAVDRTVYNSGGSDLHLEVDVGFCLRSPASLFGFWGSEL
jgi:hypothetical protein